MKTAAVKNYNSQKKSYIERVKVREHALSPRRARRRLVRQRLIRRVGRTNPLAVLLAKGVCCHVCLVPAAHTSLDHLQKTRPRRSRGMYRLKKSGRMLLHWAFWHDNKLKLPFWYSIAKDIALIQPSSAFMEWVFSILRACLDERHETFAIAIELGRRPSPSTTGEEYIYIFVSGRTLFLVLPCCAPL